MTIRLRRFPLRSLSRGPRRRPTRPLVGLAACYRITHGLGAWIYNCRYCPQRYQWPVEEGSFRQLPSARQDEIRGHAATHTIA